MLTIAAAAAAFVLGIWIGRSLPRERPQSAAAVVVQPERDEPSTGQDEEREQVIIARPPTPETRGTILVCDLRTDSSDATLRFLGDLHRVLSGIIADEGGDVDRFAGERIIATFDRRDHAAAAARAGERMIVNVDALARRLRHEIEVSAGIHTGPVSPDASTSGDTVDLAARLEVLAREHRSPLLMSEDAYEAARRPPRFRRCGGLSVNEQGLPVVEFVRDESAVQLSLIDVER
ncbi:MAG TPA: adenylate/guanylate cyclase domain-containing protein [Thermoanaerobaculia bacterium]|nr:adenylate/guanylate cyclase domain-containing protein [Thermoanaerobaculia bacterium]